MAYPNLVLKRLHQIVFEATLFSSQDGGSCARLDFVDSLAAGTPVVASCVVIMASR